VKLIPDEIFPAYRYVTADYLKAKHILALLLDVDNTLAPYEQAEPDAALLSWLEELTKNGIRLAIVSNNQGERIHRFAKNLGLPVFAKAGKPLPKAFRRAMAQLGVQPSQTACLGDQIYTDVLCGKWARLQWTVLVPPIKDKTDLFTRFKRLIEKPVMKKYWRRQTHDR